MKRKLFVILVLLLILCGCSNANEYDFDGFEHYNLNGKDLITYTYTEEYGINNIYAIADITKEDYEMGVRGLFYQISLDDYILLDKIESNNYRVSEPNKYNVFHGNKLYAIGSGSSPLISEYTLNQEKTTKKEVKFKIPETPRGLLIQTIEKVEENHIYFSAFSGYDYDSEIIKCSLDTYKCSLSENQD